MPRIFDNLTRASKLLPALREVLALSSRADFCVGYINLRGWGGVAPLIDRWKVGEGPCRILVGMQRVPEDELREHFANRGQERFGIDNRSALRLRRRLAKELREQLTFGAPTNDDEAALRRLARQLRAGRVKVKLFLRHSLHAKLYLLYRDDPVNPVTAFLGSSNLTFAGMSGQGELNVDVLDQDAARKLAGWFEDRWADRYCIDITEELVQIIDESWAREDLVSPYHVYLKMAYHLSYEAREGLNEFSIPPIFKDKLFDFQAAAVKIAARHLNKRGGVLIGDVVGLGKTRMATAVARIFEDDLGLETLIICPKNLVPMWEDHAHEYQLRAKVVSLSKVLTDLPEMRRYRLVLIDESHNLRNREGKRYRAVQEYINENESKVILLSATPYNKTYLDLSNQLRLFLDEDEDIGIRPERVLRSMGDVEFSASYQVGLRTLAAFERSENPDDWRDLMRLYLVRRTRTFIQKNYAETDPETGRPCLMMADGSRRIFPQRVPATVKFDVDDDDPNDQYARLYRKDVVRTVIGLSLPRYGLGLHLSATAEAIATDEEKRQIQNLSRAGKRLIGFCRTNLFKRLESSGSAFIQSVERHVLRNCVFLHAIREDLALPVGSQEVALLDAALPDTRFTDDEDHNAQEAIPLGDEQGHRDPWDMDTFMARAAAVYRTYRKSQFLKRFKWLRSSLFDDSLERELLEDTISLLDILKRSGRWDPTRDAKLEALHALLTEKHPDRKILVFSQFADTVDYLARQLEKLGVGDLAGVTGATDNPTLLAKRFSPESNEGMPTGASEIRVLIATDVLSEGQNLQDCAVVVNYDLPWAIIRLIQRAGRVDRIGQKDPDILCYSFLPADGVERIINLRGRVRKRLSENAEVVGADEAFFQDDEDGEQRILDLYHEKAGTLDDEDDGEVDLASQAWQIWRNATVDDPGLAETVRTLPDVVYSTRRHLLPGRPDGVLLFLRTADDHDALAYVNARTGQSVTESQVEILAAAECAPDTPAQSRDGRHHELVAKGVRHIAKEQHRTGGQLGSKRGARYRAYQRLKKWVAFAEKEMPLFNLHELRLALDDIYQYPLRGTAADALNRHLRTGMDDHALASLVVKLRDEDRLSIRDDADPEPPAPRIICSMGLFGRDDSS
ncbi:MAG: NgoFVII family restriction endonuclease [Gammaproteobacteria bacterium]|nr:NgoFVII family restriction endonuclease [Gammaproteobacteria bacterium]MYC53025.1 NgoFVII family restriction endonuclease [Gammaproteobacteria bacterium]